MWVWSCAPPSFKEIGWQWHWLSKMKPLVEKFGNVCRKKTTKKKKKERKVKSFVDE
jgi:lipopolysaccharide biosynthesis protein